MAEKSEKTTDGNGDKNEPKVHPADMGLVDLMKHLETKEPPKQELSSVDLAGIVQFIKDKKATNIITMAGAGISTSAGIPDFRSPETGLYHNLEKYNLPNPQAIFTLDYYQENPEPFCMLARELWPGTFKPTPCHYFIKMLDERGLLKRHYTQNIDTLESMAGLDPDKLVEAHGSFSKCHCLKCREYYSQDWMKGKILDKELEIPKCEREDCDGIVKPDIVFFGERLPVRFAHCVSQDFSSCDLLIIMGTSLTVQPFASLTSRVPEETPRLYINLEKTGTGPTNPFAMLMFGGGFKFDDEDNYRDVFLEGTCDDGCYKLADMLGWGDELRKRVKQEHKRIDDENVGQKGNTKSTSSPKTKAKH
ncbi:NAD-dependent protein deacetylase sirtuin-2-like [Ostrea edulis]|uniref:NAD-dependent protein deacetylase sirtuin-2-like n=1 Tax=Ostrea edulis TaxID=37623 RepID=UPI0024AE8F65|nr:NAD-dependent protein deacetylase sirtuin-2-like [Ostrea edulis]